MAKSTDNSKNNKQNKHSEGPIRGGLYKRGRNWCVRVMVRGKLVRKTVGPHKAEAEAILAAMKKERSLSHVTGEMAGVRNFFKRPDRRTFAQMATLYMDERPHLKPSTRRGYSEIFKNYLLPRFGDLFVDEITEEQIARFKAEISTKVSARRANNIMNPLRYVLKVCLRRELIQRNPAIDVSPLPEEEPDIDPLTEEEMERVLACVPSYQKPLFTCLLWTGARPDEMFALRWSDVDFNRKEIHIRKGRVRGDEGTTKTTASNPVITMLSVVREELLALKRTGTKHLDGYIFLNKHGQPYSRHIDREWRTALRKAGVRHRRSYQLRHTFASLVLSHGAQPTWVAKMLGHVSPATTFKHYARFINDASKANERILEDFIASRRTAAVKRESSS